MGIGKPVALQDMTAKLDEVVAMVDMAMIEARKMAIAQERKVEICSAKIDRLARDVLDVKGGSNYCSALGSGTNPGVRVSHSEGKSLLGPCYKCEGDGHQHPSFEIASEKRKQQMWPKPTPLV